MQPSLDHSTDGQSCDPSFNNIYRSVLYQEALKEEEAAAIFAAAWGAVDSSTEKLLAQVALQEVAIIAMFSLLRKLLLFYNFCRYCIFVHIGWRTGPVRNFLTKVSEQSTQSRLEPQSPNQSYRYTEPATNKTFLSICMHFLCTNKCV